MLNLSDVKLVIWDLDECFWKGTLTSEMPIQIVEKNIETVKKLTDGGIINSICSKNDFYQAKAILTDQARIWDYFVFPSIDFSPKGKRIKEIISDMHLRETNVLFIDDNASNLEEAKYYSPKLQVLNAIDIDKLYLAVENLPKTDVNHGRLNKYKILEQKSMVKKHVGSNEEFLWQSEIKVKFSYNCLQNIERIEELINRTNQLNYTKIRVSKLEIADLLNNPNYECALISVQDKYGDYGYVGFYCINRNNNELIHFLFSCRVLGMGIEQFVYAKLNFPTLEINGDVANPVENNVSVPWIYEKKNFIEKAIIFNGPCDMNAIIKYINIKDIEISLKSGALTYQILKYSQLTKEQVDTLGLAAPWINNVDFKNLTDIFNSKYQIIFYSLLSDSRSLLYKNKNNGIKVTSYSGVQKDLTDESNWPKFISGEYTNGVKYFSVEMLMKFKDEYQLEGYLNPQEVLSNLKKIRSLLSPDTLLVLLLGSEIELIDSTVPDFGNLAERHRQINGLIETELTNTSNIKIINYTKYINGQEDYAGGHINHFQARVYYEIAVDIIRIIDEYYND